MKSKAYILVVLALASFAAPLASQAQDDSVQSREYKIKAAFIYNFIKFVDWPKEKMADANEPIIIGIIGKDPFGKGFDPVKNKPVKDRNLVIKRFVGFKELEKSADKNEAEFDKKVESLRKCHVLFICSSEKENLEEIIKLLKGSHVLTVADSEGFLESGGIINFLMEEEKVRFEINITAAEQAKLKIRSQLLRLAKRVVNKNATGENQEKSQMHKTAYIYYEKNNNKK